METSWMDSCTAKGSTSGNTGSPIKASLLIIVLQGKGSWAGQMEVITLDRLKMVKEMALESIIALQISQRTKASGLKDWNKARDY